MKLLIVTALMILAAQSSHASWVTETELLSNLCPKDACVGNDNSRTWGLVCDSRIVDSERKNQVFVYRPSSCMCPCLPHTYDSYSEKARSGQSFFKKQNDGPRVMPGLKLTKEMKSLIRLGMSYEQVRSIIGVDGYRMEQEGLFSYTWMSEYGIIITTFDNNSLIGVNAQIPE